MDIKQLNEELNKFLYESDDQTKARELLKRVYKILWDGGFKFMNTFGNEHEGNIAYNDTPFPYDEECTDYNIGRYFKNIDYFYITGWDKNQVFGITTIYGEPLENGDVCLEEENHNCYFHETLENTDVIVYSRTDDTFDDWNLSFDFIKLTDTDEKIKSKLDNIFSEVRSDFWQEIHFSEN